MVSNRRFRIWLRALAFGAGAALLSLFAALEIQAQEFPNRPINLIVGLGAGGGTDINARLYAEVISRNLGQPMVVENRPGAGGGVAAKYVQQLPPDGYNLLVISGLQHLYLAATQPGMYEPVRGFAPVSLMFEMVSTLAIPASNSAQNISEFIAYGRKKPTGLSLGAPGIGSPPHLFSALIREATGVPVQAVQYRGSTTIMADLATGRIDLAFPTYGLGRSFLEEKKVRALAVASEKRWPVMPELPTLLEAGVIREMVPMWFGVLAPAGTPALIVRQINEQFVKASRDPELMKRLSATGNLVRTSTPEEMREFMMADSVRIEALSTRLKLRQQ